MLLLRKPIIRTAIHSALLVTLCGCAGRGGIITDEGLSLISPPGSTSDSRSQDIKKCLYTAIQIATKTNIVVPFEMTPLRGQPTGQFLMSTTLSNPKPYVDRDGNPTRAATLMLAGFGQSNISDRYVICLIGKGYKWPDAVPEATNKAIDSKLSLAQESASLYEAAWQYRYYAELPSEAERLLRRVIMIDEKTLADDHPGMITNLGEMAIALLELQRADEGLQYVNRLLPIADHAKGHSRNFTAWVFEQYAAALPPDGKSEDIERLLAMAKQLQTQKNLKIK